MQLTLTDKQAVLLTYMFAVAEQALRSETRVVLMVSPNLATDASIKRLLRAHDAGEQADPTAFLPEPDSVPEFLADYEETEQQPPIQFLTFPSDQDRFMRVLRTAMAALSDLDPTQPIDGHDMDRNIHYNVADLRTALLTGVQDTTWRPPDPDKLKDALADYNRRQLALDDLLGTSSDAGDTA